MRLRLGRLLANSWSVQNFESAVAGVFSAESAESAVSFLTPDPPDSFSSRCFKIIWKNKLNTVDLVLRQ